MNRIFKQYEKIRSRGQLIHSFYEGLSYCEFWADGNYTHKITFLRSSIKIESHDYFCQELHDFLTSK